MKILFKNKIKKRYFTSKYFINTEHILNCNAENKSVLQFICFNDEKIMACGIEECVQLIKEVLPRKILKQISIYGVKEGSIIDKKTPLLKIEGNYKHFCFLENILDGILASRSSIATNCTKAINNLKKGQEIIYMADRTNDYFLMPYEGYAAYKAGIKLFCTQAQVEFFKDSTHKVVGTIPHALIQQYHNDLNKLIKDYYYNFNQKPIVLIDFENDVIKTLETIKLNLSLVSGIRLDTSANMLDASLEEKPENYGVSIALIKLVNDWLEKNNFNHIKIVVSSGIDDKRIEEINKHNLKVDFFGIGSYFLKPSVHISADLVRLNNEQFAKNGRNELFSNIIFKYI